MRESHEPARVEPVRIELGWAAPVGLAALGSCLLGGLRPAVVALVVVALVPWVLGFAGRMIPAWAFAVLEILPVAGIVLIQDLDASMFLATTAVAQVASRVPRRWQVAACFATGITLPFTAVLGGHEFNAGAIYFAIGNVFSVVLGLLLGRTRRLGAELRAADGRLAAARAQEERTRLARDVHDLVAHSLTVVVLQVGGARRVLRADPDAAEHALAQAEQVCRDSLDGIRQVVGLLREPGAAPPSLDLARLVETYRAAGVAVDLARDGDPDALPLLVRGTLARVVQEALANAARYRAPGSTVTISLRTDAAGVTARISNPGTAGARPGPGGYGLAGLREQVAAIGGELTSGPVDDGWTVDCRLPRDATAMAAVAG